MITLKYKRYGLPITTVYYAERPKIFHQLTRYKSCAYTKKVLGFKREEAYSPIIDLTQDEEIIYSGFDKNTEYEIRRAIRDNSAEINFNVSKSDWNEVYAVFQKHRGGPKTINLDVLDKNTCFTSATIRGKLAIIHVYMVDEDMKYAKLKYSHSITDDIEDKSERAEIGRTNRLLHYQDMLFFKTQGYTQYDFGGIAVDADNTKQQGINGFKKGFGGVIGKRCDYQPYWMWLLNRITK